MDLKVTRAETFARALRTAEAAAAKLAAEGLSEDAVFDSNGTAVQGRGAIRDRLSEQWPLTPVMGRGIWSPAEASGGKIRIGADFAALGAAPRGYSLSFDYDEDGHISRVEERFDFPFKADPVAAMPAHVRSALNRALANGTPVVMSYVGDDGYPNLSLRGSVQVWGDLQLCAWLRSQEGGLTRAVRAGRPMVTLLYRDSPTRTTLTIRGRARIADDDATRDQVFDLSPEVEQTHDPKRQGAALLIDVERITGTSPQGPVLVEAKRG